MIVKLLTEHHLEFLSLKGGCTCLSESTHIKIPHCWKSHAGAHIQICVIIKCLTKGLHSTHHLHQRADKDHVCRSDFYLSRSCLLSSDKDWFQLLLQFHILL